MSWTGAKPRVIWRESIGKAEHLHFVPSEASKETRSDDTSTARNGNTNCVLWLSVATNKIRK